jgi:hypothetical protein
MVPQIVVALRIFWPLINQSGPQLNSEDNQFFACIFWPPINPQLNSEDNPSDAQYLEDLAHHKPRHFPRGSSMVPQIVVALRIFWPLINQSGPQLNSEDNQFVTQYLEDLGHHSFNINHQFRR